MNERIFDILTLSIPALLIFLTVYTVLTKQYKKEERIRYFELKKQQGKESLPIRLQAFERLTLLMHRIAPENLIPRMHTSSNDVKHFSYTLLKTIKSEYEHNITQQIYVSHQTWEAITLYKDNLTKLVREQTAALNPDEQSLKLSEAILNTIIEQPELLNYNQVMHLLKKEVKDTFI